jgi:hypothetical protein
LSEIEAALEYDGYVEYVDAKTVIGWARSVRQPDAPVSVDVLIDGNLLTTEKANQFRQDLLEAGLWTGRCGFNVPIDLRDGEACGCARDRRAGARRPREPKTHSVRVRIAGTDSHLPTVAGVITELPCSYLWPLPASGEGALPDRVMDDVVRVITFGELMWNSPRSREDSTRHQPGPLRVHIVSYEEIDDWILGKIARQLCLNLEAMGMHASVGKEPDPSAEINHHVIYHRYVDLKQTVETVMVTHIDDRRELRRLWEQLVDVDVEMGICMSFEAVHRLAHFGVPREKLCFINPAHDQVMTPRKLLVGIAARVYDDGRKREGLVERLGSVISPGDFRFVIMGSGWGRIVESLEGNGVEVEYHERFDYESYCRLIPSLDYFLYTGLDEGSMGFVDALAAGVATIVTPQGFHLDAPQGITHPFSDFGDLERVFGEIASERRRRISSVSSWTWPEYARKHALVWEYLLRKKDGRPLPPALAEDLAALGVLTSDA